MPLSISGSVGANAAAGVKQVQQRLVNLGFAFVGDVDGLVGNKTDRAAGENDKAAHLNSNAASLTTVNDASLPEGDDTPDHSGHETGMSCDLWLPKTKGTGASPGGRTVSSSDYDRDAARQILKPFRSQSLTNPDRIFLNDLTLVGEASARLLLGTITIFISK